MNELRLWAPESYWNMPVEERNRRYSGCGPENALIDFVPDTVIFLSIKESCKIHDHSYSIGESEDDRLEADRVFRNNMQRIVDFHTKNAILKWLRYWRVNQNYKAVRIWGSKAFWEGKNSAIEYRVI